MDFKGKIMDWAEVISEAIDDPESRAAGSAEPNYQVSQTVAISRDHGFFVYHLPDNQLGQGSSFGNAKVWAATKGNGDMLSFFSIDAGLRVMGGMSATYLLPFSDLSAYRSSETKVELSGLDQYARALPSSTGAIHLHPAYQQREFVVEDGLHILESFYVPRTGMEDLAVVNEVVSLKNETEHPITIIVVFSLNLRGETPRDLKADFDDTRGLIFCWNDSQKDWVRVFGGSDYPSRYCVTTDQEKAYLPGQPLPNKIDGSGDLTAALQYDVSLYPGQRRNIRVTVGFSASGRDDALNVFDSSSFDGDTLKRTIAHYRDILQTAVIEMPDEMLTPGIQWAKACMLRPIARYPIGDALTNDPGRSAHLVGRDTAWYVHGCDFVNPEWACSMLRIFAKHQRADGLIPEYVDGNTGEVVDFDFNINDDTPLYIMALDHHMKTTAHWHCVKELYENARKAGELILSQRDENGLVKCTADGMGPKAICGWRNVLRNEQITGVVTEINSECYAALRALSDLADAAGFRDDSNKYGNEAKQLRNAINRHLLNPSNGLYVLNIDLQGRVFTQATSDLVFPLMCGVADPDTAQAVIARLAESDFMTEAGIRVLPSENPNYDPSFESGCMGGVWPGVTWWYAVSASRWDPRTMAESLRRAYSHYVSDPKAYNTVPGQFSEWSDGQTLVNRGMMLSPWDSPRFIWAAIEGIAGIRMDRNSVSLDPQIPNDWLWLNVHNVKYHDGSLSYFLARESDGLHVYSCNSFDTKLIQHLYDEEVAHGAEPISTGISATAFRKSDEVLICIGSSLRLPSMGPFLAHRALNRHARYRVTTRSGHQPDWRDLGVIGGDALQRIAVRIEGRGYCLYKFNQVT